MEAAACERIFEDAEAGRVQLMWSFMHADENRQCPYPERQEEVQRLSALCGVRIGPEDAIRSLAKRIETETGLAPKDCIHLGAAHYAQADVFVTCDDGILRRADRLPLEILVSNPVDYVMRQCG